jgi:hypothetical protein
VIALVGQRSAGWCEWPGCRRPGTDRHHRLNRKAGGRHGTAAQRINGAAWLLVCCREHHQAVTSPTGAGRAAAIERGWLLLEHQHAEAVPVWTRHHLEPVLLAADGTWTPA